MTNNIALVTGGSRGLGRDMALQLAAKGYDVIITFQSNSAAADSVVADITAKGRKATALHLDVADSKSFEAFAASVKSTLQTTFNATGIDALVNNAGVGMYGAFGEIKEETLDLMYSIHVKAPFLLTQLLLPLFNNGGSIVNVSSGLSRFSYPGYSPYAIMKGAVDSLTHYQALELGSRKIRVNTVAPGAIATDFGGGTVRDNAAVNEMIASRTALGRVGQPDDIGSVVAFLCSPDAKWVNGQRIEVSGGIHL